MDIVGHRGACGHAPENTLKSFETAIALGCQRVELDVQVSADGIPVVMHDETLDRTTNGRGRVDVLILAELKALDAGQGERIPTLQEVMELCRGKVEMQIELKARSSPRLVADLIKRAWRSDHAVTTSLQLALLDEFAGLMPDIPLGLLNNKTDLDMVTVAKERGHNWICPRVDIVTQQLVQKAHASALRVYVYHVNEGNAALKLISWGVDAIGTDYPDMVSELLAVRKLDLG